LESFQRCGKMDDDLATWLKAEGGSAENVVRRNEWLMNFLCGTWEHHTVFNIGRKSRTRKRATRGPSEITQTGIRGGFSGGSQFVRGSFGEKNQSRMKALFPLTSDVDSLLLTKAVMKDER